jgi:two-component system, oxyanion-binding sensor
MMCPEPAPLKGSEGVIRVGFVPLCDCAPIAVAYELGLFAARGLQVELSREIGWATIRDKIALGELEAAHAPAAMVLGVTLGLGSFKVPCATGLVLNLHGNGITLSKRLWAEGVRDAMTLRELVRSKRNGSLLTFGIAFSGSSHNFLLQKWLRAAGLDPVRDVNIVVVPPPQMADNLRAGNLDGYCVGEPWNSVAVLQRSGWVAALSPEIAPRHPEKVLLVRSEFAQSRAEQHQQLIAALLEACAFCQRPENREQVVRILSGPDYLNGNSEIIQSSLSGRFRFRKDRVEAASDLHLFAGPGVNEPSLDKAVWARQSLEETGLLPKPLIPNRQQLSLMFLVDAFHSASARLPLPAGSLKRNLPV